MNRFPVHCLAVMVSLLIVTAARADQEEEIALQRALDQPLSLTLPSVPLSEAFKQIALTAHIPLQVDPSCYAMLPYGDTTRISVDFKQSRLRDALDEVLTPLGLQKMVVGNSVMVQPTGPLARIGRRAEWEELKLLKELWSSPDLRASTGGVFNLAEAIRAAMEGRKDLQVPIAGEGNGVTGAAQASAMAQIGRQLPMSAYRALEMYCQLTGQVWLVEAGPLFGGATGGRIQIMTPRQWVQRQLDRPIQLVSSDKPLEAVVADLAHASGIRFVPEPGLYQAVPIVNLRSDNGTVRQTLEALAGATRIAFEVRDDSILLQLVPGPGAQAQRDDNIIGRITVPVGPDGILMDVFIRESDLKPDVLERIRTRRQSAVEGLEKSLSVPPPAAAVPPATGPAAIPSTQTGAAQ